MSQVGRPMYAPSPAMNRESWTTLDFGYNVHVRLLLSADLDLQHRYNCAPAVSHSVRTATSSLGVVALVHALASALRVKAAKHAHIARF
jgi:hypothetical protein